ncbi:hypothetical protein HPB51_020419 [Rhipicephalus microplus]|uniref:Uncharacterized protein n=1 Tax=Rhipicephalus microplus TaxID=6941 RepID=A0A9J6DW21_RHIMP|nr:hypothetical protein HPB51_020419 [Rhipicephalus microplus]
MPNRSLGCLSSGLLRGMETQGVVNYTYGAKDICLTFFYFLIAIVMHAIIQEYLLDKLNRKMHLSKMKHSKFNESGQLLIFCLASFLWGAEIIRKACTFSSRELYPQTSI